jgi:phenylalanyl-tRNA synthetase beta chain
MAVQRACELVELLGAGEVVDGVMDVIAKDPIPDTVKLEPDKVNALLGTDVSAMRWPDSGKAGFQAGRRHIEVPSWRGDVEHWADIAEEVARFHGYNNIPVTLMGGNTRPRRLHPEVQQAERLAGSLCRTCGYSEIITYSFISPSYYDKINLPADSPCGTL